VLATCFDEAAEADLVCDSVLAQRERGVALHEQAVLIRTGHHSAALELELARRNIPFHKFGGLKFVEAAHVKDAVALLRVLENPRDELAWRRTLSMLEGVGPASVARVLAWLEVDGGVAVARLLAFDGVPARLSSEAVGALGALRDAVADCVGLSPAAELERLRSFCAERFAHRYPDAARRLEDLEHLATLAAAAPSRARLIAELTLDPPASTSGHAGPPHLDEDYLVISTIHSAKGGEWRVVHVLHAADGCIPSDMALADRGGLAEERRLLYVALTRARDELVVSFPQRFYHHRNGTDDAHSYGQLSRFLEPALACFASVTAGSPAVTVHDDEHVDDSAAVVDVRATVVSELTALWS
jgi:DNA helicase-2/ATP-dependent DNA helicase PcrA